MTFPATDWLTSSLAALVEGDEQSAAAVRSRADDILRPAGALAALDDVAVWAARWQGTPTPAVRRPAALIFAADHGVAIVPQATVAQEQKQGTLNVIRFRGKDFTRPLAILHRKGRVLTPAMKKFIETLGVEVPEQVQV